jgi:hypothetical protein
MHSRDLPIRRAFLVFALLLALLLLLALTLAPRAKGFVYWSQGATIGRANLDGSSLQVPWIAPQISPSSCDVAIDSNYVYWSANGAIGRANLDGSSPNPNFISTPNNSCGIAVDANYIYWANRTAIGRANLDGTGNDPNFIPNAALFIGGVDVDHLHIYWGNNEQGRIGRANLDGSGLDRSFIRAPGDTCGVDVAGNQIYWSTAQSPQGPSGVFRASLTTRHPQALIKAPTGCGVAVNSEHLYWAAESPRAVGRAELDGSNPDFSFIGSPASPTGLALDSLSAPPFLKLLPKAKLNRSLGTATLRVHITLPGSFQLVAHSVKAFARNKPAAGTYAVKVIPVAALKRRLEEKGKAKVHLTVIFRPKGGGAPQREERTLILRKKL